MIEPLTGLEVAAIVLHCEDRIRVLSNESDDRRETYARNFIDVKDRDCASAILQHNQICQVEGEQVGVQYVLDIIKTRELP